MLSITAPGVERYAEDEITKDTTKDGMVLGKTPSDGETTQHQEATHDEKVTELIDMADKMNKRAESIGRSKDPLFSLSEYHINLQPPQ